MYFELYVLWSRYIYVYLYSEYQETAQSLSMCEFISWLGLHLCGRTYLFINPVSFCAAAWSRSLLTLTRSSCLQVHIFARSSSAIFVRPSGRSFCFTDSVFIWTFHGGAWRPSSSSGPSLLVTVQQILGWPHRLPCSWLGLHVCGCTNLFISVGQH